MSGEMAIALALALPLAAALLIWATGRWPNLRETVMAITFKNAPSNGPTTICGKSIVRYVSSRSLLHISDSTSE